MQIKLTIDDKEVEIKEELLEKIKVEYKEKDERFKDRDVVYVLLGSGDINQVEYNLYWERKNRNGFIFATKEEAEKARDKRQAVWRVKEYIRINFGEFLPDWRCENYKYNFFWSDESGELNYEYSYRCKNYSPIGYLRTADHCEQLMKNCKEDLEIIFK